MIWVKFVSSYSADSSSADSDIFKIPDKDIYQKLKRWLKDFNIEFSK
jgi:hypothetical protein